MARTAAAILLVALLVGTSMASSLVSTVDSLSRRGEEVRFCIDMGTPSHSSFDMSLSFAFAKDAIMPTTFTIRTSSYSITASVSTSNAKTITLPLYSSTKSSSGEPWMSQLKNTGAIYGALYLNSVVSTPLNASVIASWSSSSSAPFSSSNDAAESSFCHSFRTGHSDDEEDSTQQHAIIARAFLIAGFGLLFLVMVTCVITCCRRLSRRARQVDMEMASIESASLTSDNTDAELAAALEESKKEIYTNPRSSMTNAMPAMAQPTYVMSQPMFTYVQPMATNMNMGMGQPTFTIVPYPMPYANTYSPQQ